MKSVRCATLDGFEAQEVAVEATLTKGLPSFSIVGLVSTAITESKERVKSALLHNGFKFPPKRITLNLSPSEVAKSGTHFDLAIALMIALHDTKHDLSEWFAFGELGLDGRIKESAAIYPLLLSLARKQKRALRVIVPKEAVAKLAKIPNMTLYGFAHLSEVIEAFERDSLHAEKKAEELRYPFVSAGGERYYYVREYPLDFKDVKGQTHAKRAAMIAAAGFHNLLLEGSPGCGKSMIAHRLWHVLPPVSLDEMLEIVKIESLSGQESDFAPKRKFIAPHHTATSASIFGGGSSGARIGEVGRAHLGELFFDELPYFSKQILEALREPMQDGVIRIARVNAKVEYKSDFLFVGALNPCPCGNLLDESKECRCSDPEIQRYKNRLSEPFLDRIDLHVTMRKSSKNDTSDISSQQMHQKVIEAFLFAKNRGQARHNGALSESECEQYCILSDEAQNVLDRAMERFALSFRSVKSLQKVARTIADLESSHMIEKEHMLEALSYRRRER